MAEAVRGKKSKKAKETATPGDDLTPSQKLAAFLVIMGEDSAATIIKQFDDHERELVCTEMMTLPLLDQAEQGAVLQEFTCIALETLNSVCGGVDFTKRVLDESVGIFKAAEIIGRIEAALEAKEEERQEATVCR